MKDLAQHPQILQNKLNLIPVNIKKVSSALKRKPKKKKSKLKKWRKKTRLKNQKKINNFLKRNEKRVKKKMKKTGNEGFENFSNKKIKSKIRASSLDLKPKSSFWDKSTRSRGRSQGSRSRSRKSDPNCISASNFLKIAKLKKTRIESNLSSKSSRIHNRKNKSMIGLRKKSLKKKEKKLIKSSKKGKRKRRRVNSQRETSLSQSMSVSKEKRKKSKSRNKENLNHSHSHWKSTKDVIDFFRDEILKQMQKNLPEEKNKNIPQKRGYYQIPRKRKSRGKRKKEVPASPITKNFEKYNLIKKRSRKRGKSKKKIIKSILESVKEESESDVEEILQRKEIEDKVDNMPEEIKFEKKINQSLDSVLFSNFLQFHRCKNVRGKFYNEFDFVSKFLSEKVKDMGEIVKIQRRDNNSVKKEKNFEDFFSEIEILLKDDNQTGFEKQYKSELREENDQLLNGTPERKFSKTDTKDNRFDDEIEEPNLEEKIFDYNEEEFNESIDGEGSEILDFEIDDDDLYGDFDGDFDDEDFDPNDILTRTGTMVTSRTLSSTVSRMMSRGDTMRSSRKPNSNFLISAVNLIEKVEQMKMRDKLE